MNSNIISPVQYIRGVGPRRAGLLNHLGIATLRDVLFYLPFRYEDRRSIKQIASLVPDEITTVSGKVVSCKIVSPSARKPWLKMLEVVVSDESGTLTAKWFNQPYLNKLFTSGKEVVLYGSVKPDTWARNRLFNKSLSLQMINPEYEVLEEDDNDRDHIHTGKIVPVYRTTEGLSQRQLRTIMYTALSTVVDALDETLPPDILKPLGLPALQECIRGVHFPPDDTSLEQLNSASTPYHQRLAFEELFILELGLAAMKKIRMREIGISFSPHYGLINKLFSALPFKLTEAQKRVLEHILADMRSPLPMNRLIQGDVGSGKTVVAVLAMLAAVECGYQTALMVPTEILAEQHFFTIQQLLQSVGVRVHLLTSSQKNKELEAIASGALDIVIGTHALIQETVSFNKLGLIVIDEQHRFGVIQRVLLRRKGISPDVLIMTATPIPRTLSITLYGDLDYSVIDELPPKRSPVVTTLVNTTKKGEIAGLIARETSKGKQVYVVYPVIEESEKMDLKNALSGMQHFQKIFPSLAVGLLHGRMKPSEREKVMSEFTAGKIHILVSTTVIEVGVDVPNVTLMVIIHAERFGLSQLHQLRGRVGRGPDQSYCVLESYRPGEEAARRLQAMLKTNDGFRIAEEDLVIRGPGEFFGTRQSGLPDLKVADILRDARLLEIARNKAFSLIENDPHLERHPLLKQGITHFWGRRFDLFRTA